MPENWEWIKLGECGDVITGMTPSKDNKLYYGGKIPFYKPTDLEQGEYTLYSSDTLSTLGFSQCRQLPCNSILVTCIGATIGKTGIIKSRGACNQQINAIVPYCFLNYQYLYYVCVSNYMQTEIRDNSSSTTLPILNKSKFSELMIPLPPLNEQFRIIRAVKDILLEIENLDREQHNLRNQIHNIKNLVIELAISGKLVPHKPLDEPATELLRRINPNYTPCDNRHYENLPATWEEIELGNICQLFDGERIINKEYVNLDVKYLRGSKDGIKLTTGKYVPKDALMILVDGENSGEVFTTPHEGYQGSTFKQLKISSELNRDYVLLLIQHSRKLLKDNKVGSAIPHLNKKIFKQIHVPIPPYNEQGRIVKAVQNAINKLDNILAEL